MLSTVSVGFLAIVLDLGYVSVSSIALFFLGAGLIPVIGVGNSFCAEMIYPINEAVG